MDEVVHKEAEPKSLSMAPVGPAFFIESLRVALSKLGQRAGVDRAKALMLMNKLGISGRRLDLGAAIKRYADILRSDPRIKIAPYTSE